MTQPETLRPGVEPAAPAVGKTGPKPKKRRPWQFYNILVHRYLGYLFLGITVVYAISGLAVNHIEDWNPNYISVKHHVIMARPADPQQLSGMDGTRLFQQLQLKHPFNPENVFYPDPGTIEILISESEKIRIDTASWRAEHELTRRRPALHLFNFLHLNEPKKGWTLYADVYAVALLAIALTGLFMKKGKKGAWGEAGIWTLAGMVLPVILILIYYR
ncbi:MAG: PepSY-associated TM helix domain-containing protein [Candidatus Sericytochromatia bacterium]